MTPAGYVNTLPFIQSRKVSLQDSQNHLMIIETLIKYHHEVAPLKADHYTCLLNTLCEQLLNLDSTFRENVVLTCFENL